MLNAQVTWKGRGEAEGVGWNIFKQIPEDYLWLWLLWNAFITIVLHFSLSMLY